MTKKNMNRVGAVLMTLALGGGTLAAQAPVPVTRMVTAGTIGEFVPAERVVVATSAGPSARYAISGETIFVDEFGTPVEAARIVPGTPVTVRYVRGADQLVASRVVIHSAGTTISKAEAKRLRDHFHDLEKRLPDGPEKDRAKAAHSYYDELEEELDD